MTAPTPVSLAAGDLLLRPWRADDRPLFAEINADPQVMQHFPKLMTVAESDLLVDRIVAGFEERGWGLWALDAPGLGFVGFVGLNPVPFAAPFNPPEAPVVEIGWRLARAAWGGGRASTAARAVLAFAFDVLEQPEVVSFTSTGNVKSRRVMERIGLIRDPDGDFDHPNVPPEAEHLRRHVLYHLSSVDYQRHSGE